MSRVSASTDDYIDFSDMGNYDHNIQRNIDRKMSEFGMVPETDRHSRSLMTQNDDTGTCDVGSCVRSMEYLQRIVKSLLRQMRVHSHVFGPGEAITIDLQAELKYDDYITLTKFIEKSKAESDKYLSRIDEIMSNFIHVVDHSSSRFDFLENIIPLRAFNSLKFWIILLTSTVICSLIVMLFFKAFNTRAVHIQLLYGFLIIFIVSCVWSFSRLYEDKKAEIHAHMVQSNGLPPKDCDYNNMGFFDSISYFFRVNIFKYEDRCSHHYATMMTDPFWKVNPMEAISTAAALLLAPLDYIGGKMGSFYVNFTGTAPLLMKPFMLMVAIFLTIAFFYGPFRISTPLFSIEPAYRPEVPALEPQQHHFHAMIGHERSTRNEIMERPDGPVVKSVRDATTDMDGFQEYITDEGTDELEIISPFARFNLEEKNSKNASTRDTSSASPTIKLLVTAKNSNMKDSNPPTSSVESENVHNTTVSSDGMCESMEKPKACNDSKLETIATDLEGTNSSIKAVTCIATLPVRSINLVKEELQRDATRDEVTMKKPDPPDSCPLP